MNKTILSLGIIFLLIGMSFTSISGIQINNQTVKDSGRGDILYVGGSGPDNYSTIQSAIDDAVDGDTIFVFDDSSPYYENVIVDKTINLIGENRDTTIIDGSQSESVIDVYGYINGIKICDFTIQNGIRGIKLSYSSDIIVKNNIFINTFISAFHVSSVKTF